jgi:hypothetical protein
MVGGRGPLSGRAAALLSVRRLQREETTGEAELRSRQRDEEWREPVVYAYHSSLVTALVDGGSGIGSSLVSALRDHSPLLSWPWSSFRFYYRQDASPLAVDPMP